MASRRERPEPRWKQRLAAATTPERQLAAAHDALTGALALFGRERRDVLLTGRCQAEAAVIMRETSARLVAAAEDVYAREREIRNTLRRGNAA